MADQPVALIVGAGPRMGLCFARAFAADGMAVALASRHPDKIADGAQSLGAKTFACDATKPADVTALFETVSKDLGVPDLVAYNPAARVVGPVQELDPEQVRRTEAILYGAFLVAQAAARGMVARGSGTLVFTGSSASVKAPAQQSAVALYKFGIRGLAQALARELQPQNIHVCHIVPWRSIQTLDKPTDPDDPDGNAHPDQIAANVVALHHQHRSTWSWELVVSPWSYNQF